MDLNSTEPAGRLNTSTERRNRYLQSSLPATVVNLQMTESASVREKVEAAILKIETVSRDHYDNISAMSTFWASDDTGGNEDSKLFISTILKLRNKETSVNTEVRVIADGEKVIPLLNSAVDQANLMTGGRKLFILHYAGHAISDCNSEQLLITPTISTEEADGSFINMTLIKDTLKDLASTSRGLDILILLDCCCSAIAGRGKAILGERVELMAATSPSGMSNSRLDGNTFTEHWCNAFDTFLGLKQPFNCNQIRDHINTNRDLAQYPAIFVLRDGRWDIPITFRALPSSTTPPSGLCAQSIITAFHLQENPNSAVVNALIVYLEGAPIPMSVLAALHVSSTLLLLHVPAYLQEILALPRISLIMGHI
jgi:Caspase domain